MPSVANAGDTTMDAITRPTVLAPILRHVEPLSVDFRTPRPSVPAKSVPSVANAGEATSDQAKPPVGPMGSHEPSARAGSGDATTRASRAAAANAATIRMAGFGIMQLSERAVHRPSLRIVQSSNYAAAWSMRWL